MELAGVERFGEEVRYVVCRAHEGYLDLHALDHIADEEVPALHVLHAIVRVVAMWRTNYAVLRAGRGRRRGVLVAGLG